MWSNVVLRKKERMRFIVNSLMRLKSKEEGTQEKLSKTNCYNLSFFSVFIFSLSRKFMPQLACEYALFAFLVYV